MLSLIDIMWLLNQSYSAEQISASVHLITLMNEDGFWASELRVTEPCWRTESIVQLQTTINGEPEPET